MSMKKIATRSAGRPKLSVVWNWRVCAEDGRISSDEDEVLASDDDEDDINSPPL